MTPDHDRWLRLSQLFDQAIELDGAARESFVRSNCSDDPALQAQLRRMLDADAAASDVDAGAAGLLVMADTDLENTEDDDGDPTGTQLGPWRLEAQIGRGGMGTVYAARRDDGDTGQRAAIKRLHRRWDGSLQAQRFLQERRILAALSHPNLPRLIDHGTDADARPWFALELVEGTSITTWADAHQLDLRERIDLFRHVCAAVQHAHEHFVVHRDLKPSNILVDNEGHPKVLDFGVAKRMDNDASATRTGAFAGFTPEYAAPEQISGGSITAATDVYALGVVLYQLLAGRLPLDFDLDDLKATADAITSRAATRLDQAITNGTPHEVNERLQQRGVDLKSFRRFVRGDLSRIVQTALAKEPERRYASVSAMSSDLARFQKGRTVSVSGDTFAYRSSKFVRRNRWAVAIGTIALVAVFAASGVAFWQAGVAKEHARSTAKVKDFVAGLLSAASPEVALGKPLMVREVLDRGAAQLGPDLEKDPDVAVELLTVMGSSYNALEQRSEARRMFDRASRIAPQAAVLQRANLAEARMMLELQQGNFTQGHAQGQTLLALLPQIDDARSRISYLLNLADLDAREGKMDAAAQHIDTAIHTARTELPENDLSLIKGLQKRGWLLQSKGDFRGSMTVLQDALARSKHTLPGNHPLKLEIMSDLTVDYVFQKRFTEAVDLQRQVVRQTRQLNGTQSLAAARELTVLCSNITANGHYADARPSCDEALIIYKRNQITRGLNLAGAEFTAARIETVSGHIDQAITLQRLAIAHASTAAGIDQPSIALMQLNLAEMLILDGQRAAARSIIEEVLAAAGPESTARAIAWLHLGVLNRQAGNIPDAQRLHEQAIALLEQTRPKGHWQVLKARLELARDQRAQGDVAASLANYQAVVHQLASSTPASRPELADAWCELGDLEAKTAAARASASTNLRQCVEFRDVVYGVDNAQTAPYRTLLTTLGPTPD